MPVLIFPENTIFGQKAFGMTLFHCQTIGMNWRMVFLTALVGIIGWMGGCADVLAQENVVQIRLTNRHVSEVLPLAQPLISPAGFISADARTNSLIVIDNPDAIARIRDLVQRVDQAVAQLKIRVRYESAESNANREARVAGQVKAGRTTVEGGKDSVDGEGVDAGLAAGHSRTQRQSDYVIRVRSGNTAYIEAGYDVPYRKRWQQLSRQYGYIPDSVVFQRVASGYVIRQV
nr:hypothetical protein [Desulfobacterales bacterium]